jgi:hypothetical protein
MKPDLLVPCSACGAAFGKNCTPTARPPKGKRWAKGTVCFGRRLRRLLTFNRLGEDPVGAIAKQTGGTRREVLEVLRERARESLS